MTTILKMFLLHQLGRMKEGVDKLILETNKPPASNKIENEEPLQRYQISQFRTGPYNQTKSS